MRRELRRRLLVFNRELSIALEKDSLEFSLLPALWSVFSYLWFHEFLRKDSI